MPTKQRDATIFSAPDLYKLTARSPLSIHISHLLLRRRPVRYHHSHLEGPEAGELVDELWGWDAGWLLAGGAVHAPGRQSDDGGVGRRGRQQPLEREAHLDTDGLRPIRRGGFARSSYFRNLEVVDADNSLGPVQSVTTLAENPGCYDIRSSSTSDWGTHFYYVGPGSNPNCS
ncbi:hypothetical protein HPP92_020755 [Vanilla planifolia]|uniref:Neprosin PEP catalytic domain-containing protein n=1 Tax=Vanilla planifolia TaxID=51239 RepID=A0A835Q0L1_VANPL|nr:hypothetical protein HPP92_020755 [Vanilla planifolia]